jgi:hypothetical protein
VPTIARKRVPNYARRPQNARVSKYKQIYVGQKLRFDANFSQNLKEHVSFRAILYFGIELIPSKFNLLQIATQIIVRRIQ